VIKYAIFEYLGDYQIDHQPLWSKRFNSFHLAVLKAVELYQRRLNADWEPDIEARPTFTLKPEDKYHIVIQESDVVDEDAFDNPPIWGIGCIPELNPEEGR
jgi:hypothetical protein